MYNAVLNNIPEEICGIPGPGVIGYFIPGQQRMSFTISYHHGITGNTSRRTEDIEDIYCSISFFNIGCPIDWKAFEEIVFEVPEGQAIKRELEMIIGPLEQFIGWSI